MTNKKTMRVGLGVIILLLLAIIVLLTVNLLRGKRIKIDHGEAGKKVVSVEAKEEAFRKAIHVVDVSAYPNNRESGYYATYVGDLTGDGKEEYLAFYGDFANTNSPQTYVDVYDFDHTQNTTSLKGRQKDPLPIAADGNSELFLCASLAEDGLLFNRAVLSDSGAWTNEFLRLKVTDGSVTLEADFIAQGRSPDADASFTETVSGAVYGSFAEMLSAARGVGLSPHRHEFYAGPAYDGQPLLTENTENHLFVLYRSETADGVTGYLRFFRPGGFSPEPMTEEETTKAPATVPVTEKKTTKAPTTVPVTEAETTEAPTAAPVDENTAMMEAYRAEVKRVAAANADGRNMETAQFILYDIDENGIPELILDTGYKTNTSGDGTAVYTYTGGNAVQYLGSMRKYYYCFYDYGPGDPSIGMVFAYHGRIGEFTYRIENGQLVETVITDFYEDQYQNDTSDAEYRSEELAPYLVMNISEWTDVLNADAYFDAAV